MAILVVTPRRFLDERGWFSETYNTRKWSTLLGEVSFVQDNESYSRQVGTVRGLHYQRPPFAQAKVVRCMRGSILDVAVDLRAGSPTYGQAVSFELSASGGQQIFIPIGFAHGFITLEPDTEIAYKVSQYYAPDHEFGLKWDDPDLAINWPTPPTGAHLSPKDLLLGGFKDFVSPFVYDGVPMALTVMPDNII
jgi:dTDP-4-dehydrorhamnose 3,5-epimerase